MAEFSLRGVLEQLGIAGPAQQPVYSPPAPTEYPSDAEAALALKSGMGYGTRNEPFMEGQITRDAGHPRGLVSAVQQQIVDAPITQVPADKQPAASDFYTKATLAANRSPISYLGFDPSKMAVESNKNQTTLGGFYLPEKDAAYANTASEDAFVHEMTHRGLERLRKSGTLSEDEQKWLDMPRREEMLVRLLMQKYGVAQVPKEEKTLGDKMNLAAAWYGKYGQGWPEMVKNLETKAQGLVAKNHPMGPN